jgi:CheY-like chemotaxis protein
MLDLNRVLLLDDSKLMRELLKAWLRPHCREVHVAGSLAEAREVLAHHDGIELALVDSILPEVAWDSWRTWPHAGTRSRTRS